MRIGFCAAAGSAVSARPARAREAASCLVQFIEASSGGRGAGGTGPRTVLRDTQNIIAIQKKPTARTRRLSSGRPLPRKIDARGPRGWCSASCRLPAECALEPRALGVAQVRAEVEDVVQDVVALEVGLVAVEMDESAGGETAVLIEHEPDTPRAPLDRLAAVAAPRLRARRLFDAVDPREAPLGEAAAGRALQSFPLGDLKGRFGEGLQHRLGPLVCGAERVKPDRHLAFGERIGQALAEPQLAALDRAAAAAALGAAARGGLEDVGHPGRIAKRWWTRGVSPRGHSNFVRWKRSQSPVPATRRRAGTPSIDGASRGWTFTRAPGPPNQYSRRVTPPTAVSVADPRYTNSTDVASGLGGGAIAARLLPQQAICLLPGMRALRERRRACRSPVRDPF